MHEGLDLEIQTTSECVMKRHIELKHETKKAVTTSKRRTCDICSKKFNKEHTFKTHMETAVMQEL